MGHKVKQSLMSSRVDFFYYAFRNVLLVSIPLLVVFALILGFSIPHSSAAVSGASADSLRLSLPTSCTLSSVVNSAHNATLISGTYNSDIGKTTITTLCNDGNGYAIYASGISNGVVGNNTLISSVSNNHNIETGIYQQGDTTSSWAMKLGNIESDTSPTPPTIEQTYDNTYGLVPSTWTKVAGRQSGTTDMITGSTFTTTYAVYTAPTQHAGTYTGQVAYVLIHGSGDNIGTLHFMQNVAEWKDTLQEGQSVQAIDIRDGKIYWVTKLKDGHIWMTQNLDFDIEANTVLDSNTTDLNVAYDPDTGNYREYLDGYTESNGIIYYAPASTATTIDFTGTTVSGWQNSNTAPYSANKTDSTETGHASLGNYYNWTAAIASDNSSNLTANTYDDITKNPQNSICPKGWRLPTISSKSETLPGSTNEFARLNHLYANVSLSPLSFVKYGYVSSNLSAFRTVGLYISSTIYSDSAVWGVALGDNDKFYTDWWNVNYGGRRGGYSLRCVAR